MCDNYINSDPDTAHIILRVNPRISYFIIVTFNNAEEQNTKNANENDTVDSVTYYMEDNS